MVKRYASETGSAWVSSLGASDAEDTLFLCQIGIVEMAAALSRKVRTRELSSEEYEAALWLFLTDVRNAVYIITPLSDLIVELAVRVTRHHPLRGYDAVHLAAALALNQALTSAGKPALAFVSADTRLCEAAQAEGLTTENPNEH